MRSFPEFFDRTGHMSDDTTNDENGCRQGIAERKGALKVFLRALGDLRGGYFQNRSYAYGADNHENDYLKAHKGPLSFFFALFAAFGGGFL